MATKLNADAIVSLLASRHREDVFVPECKNGSSQGSHLRMDAWAMAKSWAHPRTWAYEVKVSRSDFQRDNKWQGYLQYCNEFYFACPSGLIKPEEVPDGCGLLWVASTGSMMIVKRKASFRQVQIPESLYRYLLMARTRVTRDTWSDPERGNALYWKNWLEDRTEEKELGRHVAYHVARRVEHMEKQVEKVKAENAKYESIKVFLEKLGFTSGFSVPETWTIERRLKAADEIIPEHLIGSFRAAANDLLSVVKTCERYKEELQKKAAPDSIAPASSL